MLLTSRKLLQRKLLDVECDQAGQVYRGGTVMKNQSTSAALSGDQASKRDYGHHRGERPDGGQRPTLFAMPGCGLPKT